MNPKASDDVAEMLKALELWHEHWEEHRDRIQPLKDYEFLMLKLLRRFGRIK